MPQPTPTPIWEPQVTEFRGSSNLVYQVGLSIYLPQVPDDRVIRKVKMDFPDSRPVEHFVVFDRYTGSYFSSYIYVEQIKVKEPTKAWFQENVAIEIGEFRVRIACTGSMRPAIDCGDEVIYEPATRDASFQVGDIVAFRQSDTEECSSLFTAPNLIGTQYIVHRIDEKLVGFSYSTKGDNNSVPDPCAIGRGNILFRVVQVNKSVFVTDQILHDEWVREHNHLRAEYWEVWSEREGLREQREGLQEQYDALRQSGGASQSEQDTFESALRSLRSRISYLTGVLNRLRRELSEAQRGIASVVR